MLDINKIRSDFPILEQKIYGKPLVYLDNAATTQKPKPVLDRMLDYYTGGNSNIHRGVHYLSEKASTEYEQAREKVRSFINAKKSTEIIFTAGTTASVNLMAVSYGEKFVNRGDEMIVTGMEHHSNLVPWQALCKKKQAILRVLPLNQSGELQIDLLDALLTEKTRLLAVTYVSNALGVVNPVKHIIDLAHHRGVPVLVDAAQAIQHMPVDVQNLDCDFLAFSGHKMYAETGTGILYGKENFFEDMPPYQFGGGMVRSVRLTDTHLGDIPLKFEAGTPNIAGAISMAAAIDYITLIGIEKIHNHEAALMDDLCEKLNTVGGVVVYANQAAKKGVLSFNLENIDAYDAGMVLDKMGVAIRTGTHCAEPVMKHFGINGTIRASFAVYNTVQDTDRLIEGILKVRAMLS